MKIEFTRKTTKNLKKRLQLAKKWNNTKLIMKIAALLMIAMNIPEEEVADIWGITTRTLYSWRNDFLAKGMKSLTAKRRKGCPPRLSERQKAELKQIVLDGPEKARYARGTWTSAMISEIIEKKYKVSYNRRYVCDLLKQIGLTYQKGKFISDQYDSKARLLWKNVRWPELLEQAKRENAAILFEDEVGFALWGSLGYTWGLKGQQPLVKTTGRRKNLKAFGVIDYFTGRFVFQTEENKLNSKSYISFLKKVLNRFPGKIILIHDGAPYHKSGDTKEFIDSLRDRVETVRLPSYSPEFNIIEHLWKKAKAKTHNKYCPDFQSLKKHVAAVLRSLQKNISEVLVLCTSYEDMLLSSLTKAA